MMQEVSVMMAPNSQSMEQMSEEEILACLVAETEPSFTVPTKKAKRRESLLQIMDNEEDPLSKYLRENDRLQQASLRLEQENDNLALRLITSKVAFRDALDKAEDNMEELNKDLLVTRRKLQAAEEEKQGKEEEATMLKEVFRRELQKAEREIKRSSGIITDYKQICSQLTSRLEKQQTAHQQESDSLKSALRACSRCRLILDADGAAGQTEDEGSPGSGLDDCVMGLTEGELREERRRQEQEKASLKAQIRELEKELAQTKLQMVEARCEIQELEHQKGVLAHELQEAKNSWISKAFTSLKTSGGGLHGINMSKDGAPGLGWSLQKLSWPHKDHRENI